MRALNSGTNQRVRLPAMVVGLFARAAPPLVEDFTAEGAAACAADLFAGAFLAEAVRPGVFAAGAFFGPASGFFADAGFATDLAAVLLAVGFLAEADVATDVVAVFRAIAFFAVEGFAIALTVAFLAGAVLAGRPTGFLLTAFLVTVFAPAFFAAVFPVFLPAAAGLAAVFDFARLAMAIGATPHASRNDSRL